MRIAKNKKRILLINTQSPEIYIPQLETIPLMFKIFIIYQHITYGEVDGYSLRDSDSILCWIRSRLLVVGWGARLRIIRCKSAAGAGPLSWSSDQVILELQLESCDYTAFKQFRFLNKRLIYTPESVRNYLTQ